MGKAKLSKPKEQWQKHELSAHDYAIIRALNVVAEQNREQINRVIAAHLSNLAKDWGYTEEGTMLNFDVDWTVDKPEVSVQVVDLPDESEAE